VPLSDLDPCTRREARTGRGAGIPGPTAGVAAAGAGAPAVGPGIPAPHV